MVWWLCWCQWFLEPVRFLWFTMVCQGFHVPLLCSRGLLHPQGLNCALICAAHNVCSMHARCLIWLSYNGSPEIVKSMQNVNFFNHWNKLVFDFYNHVLSISASNAEKIGINFFLELFFVCMDTNSVLRDLERAVASEDSRKTQDPLDSQSGHNQKHFSTTNPINLSMKKTL